jgi:RNA polymerase sigma-70 factor (ECF subfamily)
MNSLETECEASGKGALFGEVRSLLSGERDGAGYAEIGLRLAMSAGSVRVAVHRLRRRYGELLRSEIAQTVSGPEEVEDEIRYLLSVLSQ